MKLSQMGKSRSFPTYPFSMPSTRTGSANTAGDVLAQQVAYWKRKLAGAQTMLDLPTDHSRPKEHGWRGATAELTFETNVLNALQFAQSEGATLYHGLYGRLPGLAMALYRSGQHPGWSLRPPPEVRWKSRTLLGSL